MDSDGDRTERMFSRRGAAKPSSSSLRSDMSSNDKLGRLEGLGTTGVDMLVSKLRDGMGGSLPRIVLVTMVGLKFGGALLWFASSGLDTEAGDCS